MQVPVEREKNNNKTDKKPFPHHPSRFSGWYLRN